MERINRIRDFYGVTGIYAIVNTSRSFYETEIEAARAYDIAAKEMLGDKAIVNGVDESIVPRRRRRGRRSTIDEP